MAKLTKTNKKVSPRVKFEKLINALDGEDIWLVRLNSMKELKSERWLQDKAGIDKKELKKDIGEYESNGGSLLHVTAHNNWLDLVPAEQLINLCNIADYNGRTPLHILAMIGSLDGLPDNVLRAGLGIFDCDGYAPIHYAARHGRLDGLTALDAKSLHDLLRQRDSRGSNSMHIAAFEGNFGQIPEHVLEQRDFEVESPEGYCILHIAALRGYLATVPERFKTAELLKQPDRCGATVFHKCGAAGCWDGIAESQLTREALTTQDWDGCNPLHYAAERTDDSMLVKVPKCALFPEALMQCNRSGFSALQMLVEAPEWPKNALHLLGVELPESAREVVGDVWFEANLQFCRDRERRDRLVDVSGLNEVIDLDM